MSDEIPQKQGKVGYKNPPVETRFKPGQSGNPGGNYKNTPKISNAYNRLLAMPPDEFKKFKPSNMAEEIAFRQMRAASKVDCSLPAAREITDRTEGKARQNMVIEEKPANESAMDEAFRIFCELSAHLGLSEEELRAQFDALREAEGHKQVM